MNLYHVIIRRDAQTITPVTVPEHEIALLQSIHGEENVQNGDGKPIVNHPLTDADLAGECKDSEDEFGRLATKYGDDDKGELIVEQVYGKRAIKGLERAMQECAKRQAKTVKQSKE